MGAGGGGGSDGGGSGTRAPPTPRLSTFLRTFGTSASREARSGVDVDRETHARLALLNVGGASGSAGRSSGSAGGSSSASGSSSFTGGERGGSGHRPRRHLSDISRESRSKSKSSGLARLARLVCVAGEDPDMPPKNVKEALDLFLKSVVEITGGDTFLPDHLGDVALEAFTAIGDDVLRHDDAIAARRDEAAYARDPNFVTRKTDVFQRECQTKELETLRRALGVIDASKFGAFRERAVKLAAMARRRGDTLLNGDALSNLSALNRVDDVLCVDDSEYGADVTFHAPGTRLFSDTRAAVPDGSGAADASKSSNQDDKKRLLETETKKSAGDFAASAMRASLAEAACHETTRAASIAAARRENEIGVEDTQKEPASTAASAATERLAWLKARCLEISGKDHWELAAQTVARLALASPDEKSDDAVAAELFDFFGDAGVELIVGAVERRGAIAEALRTRIAAARRRFGDDDGFDADDARNGDRPRGGGSGAPSASVTITSALDKKLEKIRKKEARSVGRRLARGEGEPLLEWLLSAGVPFGALFEGDWERAEDNEKKERAATEDEIFAALRGLSSGGRGGGRKVLPPGTTRTTHKGYEEVRVPAASQAKIGEDERFVPVAELHDWARPAFVGIKSLNRIQSRIYEAAYRGNENLLVCAPTGAGKTNIAMMTVLREVSKHVDEDTGDFFEDAEDFKIVYVAPMKALAAEVTAAFSRRLAPLGLSVRELTGDTQLSKKELDETTMLVTTPEKWDVITRKGGEVSAAATLRLLIIDEVHLLNDDRGPVIETLVARTHRQVETTQRSIRIVGLSATLPNPADVASFLGVTANGLFVFDQSFRPIPLTQRFVGVTETNAVKRTTLMAEITYEKCAGALRSGKQAMVFVHSRKDTAKTARQLAELAANRDGANLFGAPSDASADSGDDAGGHGAVIKKFQAEVNKSKNPEVKELFAKGFGCHNAGMLRADRSLVERAFAAGAIKVLVCTATLAWGVNLPAHLVVIKGTTLYDPQRGGFRDLGVLDVQQIFGRAGRPGFDTSGEGVIVTEHKKLAHYLGMLTAATPIESQFVKNLSDNLNAELVLGTVTNVKEGARWLGYSYLHARMAKNPLAYGLSWEELKLDPELNRHRAKLIREAARALDRAKMARFDERSGQLYQTESGRIASHFYIKVKSMETFDKHLTPNMQMPDILHMVAHADEFETIAPREDEMPELETLRADRKRACPIEITKATMADRVGKVNLLLQVYISRVRCEAFSLVADGSYISQNASRICRALFELCLRRGWPSLAETMLTLAKAVDLRVWPHQHALRQFQDSGTLSADVLFKLEDKKATVDRLWDMSASEIGAMLRLNADLGARVKKCVEALPHLSLEATVQPITRSVLRVSVLLTPEFTWVDRHHGGAQRWLLWVEDPVNEHVYHSETFTVTKKQHGEGAQRVAFTVPIFEPAPPQYFLRATSETWLGCETFHELELRGLVLPDKHPPHTDLLDLTPLPRKALHDDRFEALYEDKFTHFNAIQTQAFHALYHSKCNVLLGAPTGSGKTVSAELAMLRVFRDTPDRKVVYIAPLKALVRERVMDWRKKLCPLLRKTLVELTGDVTPDLRALLAADIIVATPEKWDGISRSWQSRAYVQKVALVVIDEIHLLGADRGPILETIVSRLRYISRATKSEPTRVVGLSTALANARDLADWLGIEPAPDGSNGEGLFNFRPSVRPVPLECHIQGFPGKFYCPRMASMNKPAYAAIQTHSPMKPSLVFVSSRRQTRLTALDLIQHAVADEKPHAFLKMDPSETQMWVDQTKDPHLKHCLQFGIGMHHAGLEPNDRKIAEDLFSRCKILVLVCTSTLAWGVNLPAHLVVIKGTEFYDGKQRRYVDFPITDALQMMGRAGRPQFDTSGVCVIMCHEPKKAFYKKFLYEPFPVESALRENLPDHINAEIVSGSITSKQDAVDWITWTYFFRRLVKNPSYYDLGSVDHTSVNEYLSALVEAALLKLADARCVLLNDDDDVVEPLTLGRVASVYYLQHGTVSLFATAMNSKNSFQDLVEILAGAAEYDELPVRHNEDLLCADLSSKVQNAGGFGVDARRLDDPHVKATLLFQAHWLRVPLPSSDFVTDAKGALDNAVRVLQAMIDVAADAGWLAVSLRLMNMQQALMQGRRASDPSLCVLPGVSLQDARCAAAKAKSSVAQKKRRERERERERVVGTLPELVSLARRDKEAARRALATSTGRTVSKHLDAAVAVAARLPVIDVDARVVSETKTSEIVVEVRLRRLFGEPSARRFGERAKADVATAPRAVCPLYPKIKQEGWWVVLGDREQNELHALRRVSFGDETKVRLTYEQSPSSGGSFGTPSFVLYLVSDCYLGLDQEVDVVCHAVPGSRDGRRTFSTDVRGYGAPCEKKEESFWLAADDAVEDDDAFFWENEA
jgi:activating signal cointegrator complex subunit 3